MEISVKIDEMGTKTEESMKFEICRTNKNHVPDHMCPGVGSVASGDERFFAEGNVVFLASFHTSYIISLVGVLLYFANGLHSRSRSFP